MKKNIITILLTIVFLSILATLVYGADLQIAINGDSTVKPGESKELIINISSDEEIGIVSGKIEASSNITDMTVTGLNSWNLTYNSNTGEFNIYKAEGAKVQDIINIQYKAGAEEGTGTITLSNIKMTTISYVSEDIGTITKDITIENEQQTTPETPTAKTLRSISVTKAATKTTYTEGESFDKTGMKVTATYSDGSSKEIATYTVTDGENLTSGKTSVTISYTENGVTKTTVQEITVTKSNANNQQSGNNKKEENIKTDSSDNKQDGSIKDAKLPQTGLYSSVIGIIAVMSILSAVFYVKYNKYKKI